jgi:hypothetical protein
LKYELTYPGDFATGRDLFVAVERIESISTTIDVRTRRAATARQRNCFYPVQMIEHKQITREISSGCVEGAAQHRLEKICDAGECGARHE